MARPKYPSDHARDRRKQHAKVHLSWPTHPRYAAAYDDLEIRAVITGIWVEATRAFASQTDDTVTLSPGLACSVAGASRLRDARTRLARACLAMGYDLSMDGPTVVIRVRNFSIKQGFATQTPADSASDSAGMLRPPKLRNSEAPSAERRKEEKTKSAAAPRRRASAVEAPDELDPADLQRVLAWFADVLPRELDPDRLIEEALGFYRRRGDRFASWPDAVIDNVRARENGRRERAGEAPLRSRAESNRLRRAVDAERTRQDAEAVA